MPEADKAPDRPTTKAPKVPTARDQVLRELAVYLHQRNTPQRKCCDFLDRPIFLTLFGGILLSLVTLQLQFSEQRRNLDLQHQRSLLDQQFSLLRTFPAVYHRSGNHINNWLVHLLWVAEERNKPAEARQSADIDRWTKEIQRLQQEFPTIEQADGVLAQIEVLFKSGDTVTTAKAMRAHFSRLETLTERTNRRYNVAQTLAADEISEAASERREIVDQLDSLKDKLIGAMGAELSSRR